MLETIGLVLAWVLVVGLCLLGLLLSALSISGTWLVPLAGLVVHILHPAFPGYGTLAVMLILCAAVEVLAAMSASWGVKQRGGSTWAGVLALLGGLLGMVLGGFLPLPPVIGPLLGMLLGSFFPVYYWERHRLQAGEQAAHIARGAVLARVLVIMLKGFVTLVLVVWLFSGVFLT